MKYDLPTNTTVTKVINHKKAGQLVRATRERNNMSLRRLASLMGLSAPFISDLELGRRHWSADRFKEAMRIIETSTN